MGATTDIQWTDATWNPVRGCSRVSAGCVNCYAEKVAVRFGGHGLPYEGLTTDGRWNGTVKMVPEHLADPLRWKKPRRIFVNSMSDLFHESLGWDDIAAVFGVMAFAQHHVFQVLTKRPERAREFFDRFYRNDPVMCVRWWKNAALDFLRVHAANVSFGIRNRPSADTTPLPNVWLGVSVENQASADERLPQLLATPAQVRFVSAEPLLGPVEMLPWLLQRHDCWSGPTKECSRVNWVIVGGESGGDARPCDVGWIRSLVAQCKEAGVAAFVKQLGSRPTSAPPPSFEGKLAFLRGLRSGVKIHADGADFVLRHPKGGDPSEWPKEFRVREFPKEMTGES